MFLPPSLFHCFLLFYHTAFSFLFFFVFQVLEITEEDVGTKFDETKLLNQNEIFKSNNVKKFDNFCFLLFSSFVFSFLLIFTFFILFYFFHLFHYLFPLFFLFLSHPRSPMKYLLLCPYGAMWSILCPCQLR